MEKKVYLIFECSGLYEDYEEYLLKAFFNKDKAKQFQKQKEKELEILKERYENKCCNCAYGDQYCNLYKKPEEEYDEDCENRVLWHDIDNTSYALIEIEVE